MNMITLTGQKIHNLYVEALTAIDDLTANPLPIVVMYSLDVQGNVQHVCFHRRHDAMVLSCLELADALTEAQWLALRTGDESNPLFMVPQKVAAIDGALGIITCSALQYQSLIGYFDDLGYLHKLKQTDKIDRVAIISPLDGGRVNFKAIISDAPTETWWLANVVSVSVQVESLTFDVP